jgi:hypothetical protein
MNNSVLLGVWRMMISVPPALWQNQLSKETQAQAGLDFMSADHHSVRDFVVLEMPRINRPISPDIIADKLSLPVGRVISILDELERGMTFLFRNTSGEVTWAYPVTVDKTPHMVTFSTGEQLYAAWAADAIATPFVQGQLRNEKLTVHIETECGHCHIQMNLEVNSELNFTVREKNASPMVFIPMMNLKKLDAPNIIEDFWRNSIFFWSEEHARDFRRKNNLKRGIYMTLLQSMTLTRLAQSAIFSFPRKVWI